MKYRESKERSAEILRAAIALMGQHDAALNPLTFAVWYEHAAGINPRLSEAIGQCLRDHRRLGDDTIAHLHRAYVSEPDREAVRQASGQLERVMSGMADSATRTSQQAELFGRTLGGLEEALQTEPGASLVPMVGRALEGTSTMRQTAAALQQQVSASRAEIERLRADLVRARDEALLDPLTQVLNRKGFDQKLEAMMALAPGGDRTHCLVMFDIDRFKAVNDTYGHVMGDRVLQAVAEVLRSAAPDAENALARYGGEEFALLLPGAAIDGALALAESCRERVKALKVRDRRTQNVILTVTISAGVASAQGDDDAVSLITRADEALYAAKQAGRDRVHRA